jgi:hypothetical protein
MLPSAEKKDPNTSVTMADWCLRCGTSAYSLRRDRKVPWYDGWEEKDKIKEGAWGIEIQWGEALDRGEGSRPNIVNIAASIDAGPNRQGTPPDSIAKPWQRRRLGRRKKAETAGNKTAFCFCSLCKVNSCWHYAYSSAGRTYNGAWSTIVH